MDIEEYRKNVNKFDRVLKDLIWVCDYGEEFQIKESNKFLNSILPILEDYMVSNDLEVGNV